MSSALSVSDVDAIIDRMTEEELIDFMGPQFWISLVHKHLSDEVWVPDVRREVRDHLLDVQVGRLRPQAGA